MSVSTTANYHTAVRSFLQFSGEGSVLLTDLDAPCVARYEHWLRDRGVCPNTSSCYVRSLRAIYNKAVARHMVRDKKPFCHAFTGNDRTRKRSVAASELRRLQVAELPLHSPLALARDVFIFSFCAMGMPFVDIAGLRRHQVKGGVLTYCRRKTGRQVRVKIEGIMQDIIDRYARKDTDYLFPLLYRVTGSHTEHRSYATALCGYNRMLSLLARTTGIRGHLSSYVSRHSWASIAYRSNVGLPIISQALGHSDPHTTLIYIRGIDDHQVARANRKLLVDVLSPPLGKRWTTICYRPQN